MEVDNKLERDKDLYTLAVMRYKEENPNIDVYSSFTDDWNISKNYNLKTTIIADAINNHVLIENTELYKENFVNDNKELKL